MFLIDLGAPSYYSVLGVLPGADPREVRAQQSKKHAELDRELARTTDPDKRRKLTEQQQVNNRIGDELSDPRKRQAYDETNAHLTFFVVRRAAAPMFDEREPRLRWIHRAVRDFLQRKGEQVDPITDLERVDFTADFSDNAWLDRLLRTGIGTGGTSEQEQTRAPAGSRQPATTVGSGAPEEPGRSRQVRPPDQPCDRRSGRGQRGPGPVSPQRQ